MRDGRLGSLRPGQANQFGWFYPAVAGSPALVELPGVGRWPRRVSPQALTILARHGVPVRLLDRGAGTGVSAGGGASDGLRWWAGGIGVALGIGAVVLLVRRKAAGH